MLANARAQAQYCAMSIYIQVGAGAGDQDSRANFRDGFTEYVKGVNPKPDDRIILVEPNPANITLLRRCWQDYPQVEIIHKGIRPAGSTQAEVVFYYAAEDGPHYQVFSMRQSHVLKHYPHSALHSVTVPTLTMAELLASAPGPIELLALDIEGIDAEILLESDWSSTAIRKISFEFLHLGDQARRVYAALSGAGYIRTGWGVDVNRYDLMYERPDTLGERVMCWVKWLCGGWWTVGRGSLKALGRRFTAG